MSNLWGAQWHSKNRLDGEIKYIIYENYLPKLFKTRQSCRDYIQEQFGYIAERPDLQDEPFGWKLPQPVKVKLIVQP